ncbi:5'-nucleotidase C-terminal domain-containing protein [Aliagarivorans marinus]|uniref:5'-nucleotidase C-terminal domain-containing protein n=1 Tax=Aliagarivorans marinus TaxID=561965 RepID=UPI000420B51F|nr:5'-nucleotidase C-terminal domain-containing protein [Aliagarivorans marinus]
MGNWKHLVWAVPLSFALVGCNDDDDAVEAAYTLQLLHMADMDGATGALDNVEAFSGILAALRAEYANTLTLSSGDNYIPGPRYAASSDDSLAAIIGEAGAGRADIAFLNAMGVQASAVGNHDLDGGTEEFVSIINADGNYVGAQFPYLSANLDFSTDANTAALIGNDGDPADSMANQLAAYTTIDVNGETFGIVGATTPTLANITSTGDITITPDNATDLAALAAVIQTSVDALLGMDVNKIILLAHMQQLSVEQGLAPLLNGVDIIVAGGSNTLLADSNDTLMTGDTAAGDYPLQYNGVSGDPVLVVNVDGDYKYVGRLVVGFDEEGRILPSTVDEDVSGVFAATSEVLTSVGGTAIAAVTEITDALNDVLIARDGNILGNSSVYLDGRRSQVRTQETNMGNLTADANLWYAQEYDNTVQISLKNGGGIRDDIGYFVYPPGSTNEDDLQFFPNAANDTTGKGQGDISQFDIEGTLRFNNALVIFDVTAAELYELLEHGVSSYPEQGGRFPQVAGMQFSFDPDGDARVADGTTVTTVGTRVQNVVVLDADGNKDVVVQDGAVMGDPNRVFRMVSLGFLASEQDDGTGGDGFPWAFPLENFVELETSMGANDPGMSDFADAGSEQDALAEYLMALYPDSASAFAVAETEAASDERIQNLSVRTDTVTD